MPWDDPLHAFHDYYDSAQAAFIHRIGGADGFQSVPIGAAGPDGGELAMLAVWFGSPDAERLLILSSGLHGVEGFFGSAVQVHAIRDVLDHGKAVPEGVRVLLLHALNPFGFAWVRRFDEHNVDPNRNFLLPGEGYCGAPEGYRQLDPLLNPRRPPSRWDPFPLRAAWTLLRHGRAAVKQAVAGGQYEHPKGLFYGGDGPSTSHRMLDEHLPRWVGDAETVLHLDFHTGLGKWGEHALLLSVPLPPPQLEGLERTFSPSRIEVNDPHGTAYRTRGDIGTWCRHRFPEKIYLPLCAEFGTYSPVRVVAALRAENQAHHWLGGEVRPDHWTKRRLKEVFCPASPTWRRKVIEDATGLVRSALAALAKDGPPSSVEA
jgi:hypothetical protein